MTLTKTSMRPRAVCLLLLAALFAHQWSNSAKAAVCDGIPECEPQVQAPVPFGAWETKGWAFYCTGDHPYFWGLWWYDPINAPANQTYDWSSATGQKSCFISPTEWAGPEEGNPSKLNISTTNFCNADELRVTLACTKSLPPGGSINGCTPDSGILADPGCPTTWENNNCQNGAVPVCFQNAIETCSDGTKYGCTALFGAVWCQRCAP
jgi:hypothetical protein